MTIKGKNVLLIGLGLLGGGVATANWLLKNGAILTITDLKTRKQLAPSIKALRKGATLHLGRHRETDLKKTDLLVLNPGTPIDNRYVQLAMRLGIPVTNEAALFYERWTKPMVAITGTRGKTTTAHWINHFLKAEKKSILAGNSPTAQFLKMLDKQRSHDIAVVEISSYHFEVLTQDANPPNGGRAPDVAVITNLYHDHLNRHGSIDRYARLKARIFKHQIANQHLVLNADDRWTPFFLNQKPAGHVWYTSLHRLPNAKPGIFLEHDIVRFNSGSGITDVLRIPEFANTWGTHNLYNVLASVLAAHIAGISWQHIQSRITTLPSVPFRQETILETERVKVINDTAATTPEGGKAAIERFNSPSTFLIAGGSDAQLDYKEWARLVKEYFIPERVFLLEGTATEKMLKALDTFGESLIPYKTLAACLKALVAESSKYAKPTILFSPAAKSFGLFVNEYDRGEQFARIIKKLIKG